MVKIKRAKPSKRDPNRPKNKEKYKPKALSRGPAEALKHKERKAKKKQLKLARKVRNAAENAAKTASKEPKAKSAMDTEPDLMMVDDQTGDAGANHTPDKSGKRKFEAEEFISIELDEPQTKKTKTSKQKKEERAAAYQEKVKKSKKKAETNGESAAKNLDSENQMDVDARTDGEKNGVADTATSSGKPSKKDKKKKKNKDVNVAEHNSPAQANRFLRKEKEEAHQRTATEEEGGEAAAANAEATTDGKQQQHRFILFAGNLPFSTTDAQLEEHFAPFHPTAIRHRTHPKEIASSAQQKEKDRGGKSKGFAFLEFASWSTMKLCMAKMHHSEILDDKGNPRKINVELTAGGGGKGEQRKNKLKEKNARLEDERRRKAKVREEEKKVKSEMKDAQAGEQTKVEEINTDIHPSRRARVKQ